MKMSKLVQWVGVLAICMVGAAMPAHAIPLKGYIGADLAMPSGSDANGVSNSALQTGTGLALGVGTELPLAPFFSLGVDVLWVNRNLKAEVGSSTYENKFKYLMIPVMARFSPIDLLSVGAGAYFATGLGDITSKTTVAGVSAEGSTSYDSLNYKKTDFGVTLGGSFNFPVAPLLDLMLDLRYNLGLADIDSSANSAKWRDVMVMTGVKFTLL